MKYILLLVLLTGCMCESPKPDVTIDWEEIRQTCNVISQFHQSKNINEEKECIKTTTQQIKLYESIVAKLSKRERESGILMSRPNLEYCSRFTRQKTDYIYDNCVIYFTGR